MFPRETAAEGVALHVMPREGGPVHLRLSGACFFCLPGGATHLPLSGRGFESTLGSPQAHQLPLGSVEWSSLSFKAPLLGCSCFSK